MLFLQENQLSSLPPEIGELTNLTALYLHGNQLGIPEEVLASKPKDIIRYYFEARKDQRPLNEAKLILVGRGAVGKTSLVNRLVHDKFDRHEEKTEGIKITEWPVTLANNDEVTLNIWDFGGQEIMHATHQFFLTKRSLYLVVLIGREGGEDADAEYWLRLLESFAGDSPVIVVLNKTKEQSFALNRTGLRKKFPVIQGFVETDCADRVGIDELSETIRRETDRLEGLRDPFPGSWFAIKDRLADMRKKGENYLTFPAYQTICANEGEKDEETQEQLAGYLHNLGIALNYKDDPRLRDTHVLNPHWVTNGIYKILNADKLAKNRGELNLADLDEILDKTAYPRDRSVFLIDLMRKFELCFSFSENDERYLVPGLLDKDEPLEKGEPLDVGEFLPGDCLSFEYHYPILPEGLLPRFIVRTHALSSNTERWRSGAILELEDNRALVRADAQDRRVTVSVSGPAESRRRLLAVVRSDFDRIHREYQFQIKEMVPIPGHPGEFVPYKDLQTIESQGLERFSKVIGPKVVEYDVRTLLNGVDLVDSCKLEEMEAVGSSRIRIFYSYAHKDEELRNELETHLKILERMNLIEPWHDRLIKASDDWKERIDENLESAEIILLLVSADFIASDYCWEKEMTRALARHDESKAQVIPVILRDVKWSGAPFGKLQALPKDGTPVTLWKDRDQAWRNVSEGIEAAVESIRASRRIP